MVFGGAVCTLVALWGMLELAATLGLALAYAIVTLAVWRGPALVCLVSVTHWVGTGYPRSVAWPLRLVLFARAAMAVSPRCAVPLQPCWVCGSGYPCALGPGGVGVFVCLALCGPALVSLALAALVGWPVLVSLVRWSVGLGSTTGSVPCVPCAGGLASVCHAVAALLGQSSCGYPCVLRPCGSGLAVFFFFFCGGGALVCLALASLVGLLVLATLAAVWCVRCLALAVSPRCAMPITTLRVCLASVTLVCCGRRRSIITRALRSAAPPRCACHCGPCGLAGVGYPCALACLGRLALCACPAAHCGQVSGPLLESNAPLKRRCKYLFCFGRFILELGPG